MSANGQSCLEYAALEPLVCDARNGLDTLRHVIENIVASYGRNPVHLDHRDRELLEYVLIEASEKADALHAAYYAGWGEQADLQTLAEAA